MKSVCRKTADWLAAVICSLLLLYKYIQLFFLELFQSVDIQKYKIFMYAIYCNYRNNVCVVNNLLFAAADKTAEVFFFKFVCCENCALAYEKNFQTFSCKNLQVFFFCKNVQLFCLKNLH